MKLSKVAYKAADIVAERGLAKGRLVDEQGRVCHDGAIRIATGAVVVNHFTKGVVESYLKGISREALHMLTCIETRSSEILHEKFHIFEPAFRWNDRDCRSAEDVILLLKEVGKSFEDEGL